MRAFRHKQMVFFPFSIDHMRSKIKHSRLKRVSFWSWENYNALYCGEEELKYAVKI